MEPEALAEHLNLVLEGLAIDHPVGTCVTNLTRLSGGANNETWRFTWHETPLILRRRPFSAESVENLDGNILGLSLVDEAHIIQLAAQTGVPVPHIYTVLETSHPLGESFVMAFIPGESIPQQWLNADAFSSARKGLAYECGAALAQTHTVDCSQLPQSIKPLTLARRFDGIQRRLQIFGDVSPAMQFGLNWLIDHAPEDVPCVLLHGDFRTGNLLVNEQGLSGILDWELAHQGPPAEDLGYLCAHVWRFGNIEKPVGGFGEYADLLAGYRSIAGWAPDLESLKYWEIFAALNWGLVCQTMGALWHSGSGDIERAAVARRRSEAELDLIYLIDAWGTL